MDHLADSIAKLSQGRENWYIGREGIPVDDSSWEKCEPVFESMDLSICQGVNVSGLFCVSNKVLRCWDSYKVSKCAADQRLCFPIHFIDGTIPLLYKSENSSL